MAVPVLENNLAEHLKSGCLGTHPLNSKSLYRAQEKKRKLDFFLNYAAGQDDCRDELDEQM